METRFAVAANILLVLDHGIRGDGGNLLIRGWYGRSVPRSECAGGGGVGIVILEGSRLAAPHPRIHC